jgi:hypothetical protein
MRFRGGNTRLRHNQELTAPRALRTITGAVVIDDETTATRWAQETNGHGVPLGGPTVPAAGGGQHLSRPEGLSRGKVVTDGPSRRSSRSRDSTPSAGCRKSGGPFTAEHVAVARRYLDARSKVPEKVPCADVARQQFGTARASSSSNSTSATKSRTRCRSPARWSSTTSRRLHDGHKKRMGMACRSDYVDHCYPKGRMFARVQAESISDSTRSGATPRGG